MSDDYDLLIKIFKQDEIMPIDTSQEYEQKFIKFGLSKEQYKEGAESFLHF